LVDSLQVIADILIFILAIVLLGISCAKYRLSKSPAFFWIIAAFVYALIMRGWVVLDDLEIVISAPYTQVILGWWVLFTIGFYQVYRVLKKYIK
jgi:hypothetical protein